MEIKVSKMYTETPGGRFKKDGEFSGEHFRDTFLESYVLNAIKNKEKLIINLDGGYGYSAGFLEESFGGLVRKGYNANDLLEILIIVSNEEPELIEEIKSYILDSSNIIKLNNFSRIKK